MNDDPLLFQKIDKAECEKMKSPIDITSEPKRTYHYFPILFAGFIAGVITTSIAFFLVNQKAIQSYDELHRPTGNTVFTNPLLSCDTGYENLTSALAPFQSIIEDEIKTLKKDSDIKFISFYFRELDNGSWYAINGEEKFTPASLFKVPVMMAILQASATDSALLQKKLPYNLSEDYGEEQNIKPATYLDDNSEYTVEELIKQMIQNSDNQALFALEPVIDTNRLKAVLRLAELEIGDDPSDSIVNVVKYASFFRILYNASFLGIDQSEKALEILSQSSFDQGIEAGLPKQVKSAHKFGERRLADNTLQLHDCGIVYVPHHNYLICVMTRGNNFEKLIKAISRLSAITYQQVTKTQPQYNVQ